MSPIMIYLILDFNNFFWRCISSDVIPNPYTPPDESNPHLFPGSGVIIFGATNIEESFGIGGGGGGVGIGADMLRESIGTRGFSSDSSMIM